MKIRDAQNIEHSKNLSTEVFAIKVQRARQSIYFIFGLLHGHKYALRVPQWSLRLTMATFYLQLHSLSACERGSPSCTAMSQSRTGKAYC